jgi:hypothetical protein
MGFRVVCNSVLDGLIFDILSTGYLSQERVQPFTKCTSHIPEIVNFVTFAH